MRRPLLVANWKLNKTVAEAQQFVAELVAAEVLPQALDRLDVAVAPPLTALWPLAAPLRQAGVALCAQDFYFAPQGAYTGAVSAPLVAEAGASYALVGHSERRALFGETPATTQKRLAQALAHHLVPILCVGENWTEREAGSTNEVVAGQVRAALEGVALEDGAKLVLAYEPVWAIGTGKQADVATAAAVHQHLRQVVEKLCGTACAEAVRILYGGSVTAAGVGELLAAADVDGALVGGASLQATSFAQLLGYAAEACDGR